MLKTNRQKLKAGMLNVYENLLGLASQFVIITLLFIVECKVDENERKDDALTR